jgi:hypothetical protein
MFDRMGGSVWKDKKNPKDNAPPGKDGMTKGKVPRNVSRDITVAIVKRKGRLVMETCCV